MFVIDIIKDLVKLDTDTYNENCSIITNYLNNSDLESLHHRTLPVHYIDVNEKLRE